MTPYTALVPLDGSARSRALLPALDQVLNPQAYRLTLLWVGKLPRISLFAGLAHLWLESQLQLAAQRLRAQGYTVSTAVRLGDPAAEIIRFVQQEGITLVAMAAQQRSGLAQLVFGRVAEEVQRQVRVPVLLLRPPKPQQPHAARPRWRSTALARIRSADV